MMRRISINQKCGVGHLSCSTIAAAVRAAECELLTQEVIEHGTH